MLVFDVIGLGDPSLAGRYRSSGEDWAVLVETSENQNSRTLIRRIETFRLVDEFYRRGCEIHRIRLFDIAELRDQLAACGFSVETAQSYSAQPLGPRRSAFFCTRMHTLETQSGYRD
jgi:hypothetical protein